MVVRVKSKSIMSKYQKQEVIIVVVVIGSEWMLLALNQESLLDMRALFRKNPFNEFHLVCVMRVVMTYEAIV